MEKFVLERSPKTPEVVLDHETGTITMRGRSIPEDPISFFQPIVKWIDVYVQQPAEKTSVEFKFEYFNTSSSKWLIVIFKSLNKLFAEGREMEVNWYYDYDDLYDYGQEIKELVDYPINLLEF